MTELSLRCIFWVPRWRNDAFAAFVGTVGTDIGTDIVNHLIKIHLVFIGTSHSSTKTVEKKNHVARTSNRGINNLFSNPLELGTPVVLLQLLLFLDFLGERELTPSIGVLRLKSLPSITSNISSSSRSSSMFEHCLFITKWALKRIKSGKGKGSEGGLPTLKVCIY